MTLKTQLLITVCLLFALTFIGTFLIGVNNIHNFLTTQLSTQAQNAASSLGVSISQYTETGNDTGITQTLIDSVFDTGYYSTIKLVSLDNKTIYERTQTIGKYSVPQWFKQIRPMELSPGNALIMSGWKQLGTLYVYSDSESAYFALWNNTLQIFWWFLGCALLTLGFGFIALHYLLKPLKAVEKQADAICSRDFSIQNPLPHTQELYSVVSAMNKMSAKVRTMFDEQTELTEKLRELAFKDPLTNLANRRYFNSQLANLISAPEEFFTGALYLIELKDFDLYKKANGYTAADQYLTRMATVLKEFQSKESTAFSCRFSDVTFALLVPNISIQAAIELATQINYSLSQLNESLNLTQIKSNMGLAIYEKGITVSQLLSQADMALRSAETKGENTWHRYDAAELSKEQIQGARNWDEFLQKTIEEENIVLYFQPVVCLKTSIDNHNKYLHHEVLLRIPDKEGQLLNAGVFIPMAENLNKMPALDKLVISKLLNKINTSPSSDHKFAVNISPSSLRDLTFVNWLGETIKDNPRFSSRLILELSEHNAIQQLEALQHMMNVFKPFGVEFSLDHFGRGFASFKYLRTLAIDYLKIDGSYIRNIQNDAGNQLVVNNIISIAHNLDIKVVAENVESNEEVILLRSLNIDGAQGYFTGKPSDIDDSGSLSAQDTK